MSYEKIDYVEQLLAEQPTRSGKKRPDRRFDKTQLKSTHHGRYVHRDYAAHFFRWGWASRMITRSARILDVGCGQEIPLMWVLSGNMTIIPELYVGVDLNKVDPTGAPKWAKIIEEFSFVDEYIDSLAEKAGLHRGDDKELFDYIVNFEVIEHMKPEDGVKMLTGFHYWLKDSGLVFLSTPVFDGHAAVNHVHEYTIPELKILIESCGFQVLKRYGTFASAHDIKKAANTEDLIVWEKLQQFYGGDVLSTFLAPLYPDVSRNNLWVLSKRS
jgi:2-polyprenyl-3-methyl-5-hydroxy-6-metoxy-1,4-benzoquinol methylase